MPPTGGIRTRNPSKRAASDPLFKSRSCWGPADCIDTWTCLESSRCSVNDSGAKGAELSAPLTMHIPTHVRQADYQSFCLHHNSSVLLASVYIPHSAVRLQHLASLLFHSARTEPPSISLPRLKEEGSTNRAVFPNALYSADISQSLLIMVFCH